MLRCKAAAGGEGCRLAAAATPAPAPSLHAATTPPSAPAVAAQACAASRRLLQPVPHPRPPAAPLVALQHRLPAELPQNRLLCRCRLLLHALLHRAAAGQEGEQRPAMPPPRCPQRWWAFLRLPQSSPTAPARQPLQPPSRLLPQLRCRLPGAATAPSAARRWPPGRQLSAARRGPRRAAPSAAVAAACAAAICRHALNASHERAGTRGPLLAAEWRRVPPRAASCLPCSHEHLPAIPKRLVCSPGLMAGS